MLVVSVGPEKPKTPTKAAVEPKKPIEPQEPMGQELPQLEPETAGYLGAAEGPFRCDHCLYFNEPSACHLVAGPIEAEGCCNLFVKKSESPTLKDEDEDED